MDKIKVLLADDHAVLRAGLRELFNKQPDIQVVAEAADGWETVRQYQKYSPDIVLMDISMPGLGGFEATQQIKKQNPRAKVLVLTMHDDENYLCQMVRAGADGYVPKKAADTDLLAAIRAVYRGENFIHSSMTKRLLEELRNKESPNPVTKPDSVALSERERQVLSLLAMGHTSQQIADKLYLSVKTVETYKTRLKEKLGAQGRAELVRYAIQNGLLEIKV